MEKSVRRKGVGETYARKRLLGTARLVPDTMITTQALWTYPSTHPELAYPVVLVRHGRFSVAASSVYSRMARGAHISLHSFQMPSIIRHVMPDPDRPQPKGRPVVREVLIYSRTNQSQAEATEDGFYKNVTTKLIKTVKSGQDASPVSALYTLIHSVLPDGVFGAGWPYHACGHCVPIGYETLPFARCVKSRQPKGIQRHLSSMSSSRASSSSATPTTTRSGGAEKRR